MKRQSRAGRPASASHGSDSDSSESSEESVMLRPSAVAAASSDHRRQHAYSELRKFYEPSTDSSDAQAPPQLRRKVRQHSGVVVNRGRHRVPQSGDPIVPTPGAAGLADDFFTHFLPCFFSTPTKMRVWYSLFSRRLPGLTQNDLVTQWRLASDGLVRTQDMGGGVVTVYIGNPKFFFSAWYLNLQRHGRLRPVGKAGSLLRVLYWDTGGTPVFRMKVTYFFIQFPGLHVQPGAPDSAICPLFTVAGYGAKISDAQMEAINRLRFSILHELASLRVVESINERGVETWRDITCRTIGLSDLKGASEEFGDVRSQVAPQFPSKPEKAQGDKPAKGPQNRMHYDDCSPSCRRSIAEMLCTTGGVPETEACKHGRDAVMWKGVPGASIRWFYGRHGLMHGVPRLGIDAVALLDKTPGTRRHARYLSRMFPESTWYPYRHTAPKEWDAKVQAIVSDKTKERMTRTPRPPHCVQLDTVKRFLLDSGDSLLAGRGPEAPLQGERPLQRINPATVYDVLLRSAVRLYATSAENSKSRLLCDLWDAAVRHSRLVLHYDPVLGAAGYASDVAQLGRTVWFWWKRLVCHLWPWRPPDDAKWMQRLEKDQPEQAVRMRSIEGDMRVCALWVAPYVFLNHGCDLYADIGSEAAEVTEEPLEHVILRVEYVAAASGERPTALQTPLKLGAIVFFGCISLWPPISTPGVRVREATSKSYGRVEEARGRGDVVISFAEYEKVRRAHGVA